MTVWEDPASESCVIESYRFSDDILARVRERFANDNWHGPLELIRHWLVIAAAAGGSLWCMRHAPAGVAGASYAVAIWFIGGRQRALADILHQAAHRTLMRNANVERVLGTFASGYLILQSFTGYVASHVRDHHGRLGDPHADPDYIQYQRNGLCGPDVERTTIRRYILRILAPSVMLRYIVYLFRDRIWHAEEARRERAVRLSFLTLLVALVAVSGTWPLVFLYWLVPLVTTQVWIGSFIELTEHYPMIDADPRVDIFMSRNRHCSRLSNFALGITPHEGYHLIHHKFAAVPPWRHHEVHAILMEDPLYASVNTARGWRAVLRDVMRVSPRTNAIALPDHNRR